MEARSKLEKYGLYDSRFEHDACGVGFVCNIKGNRSHTIIRQGLQILNKLSHRGATGADPQTGDGAGLLIQMPHEFLSEVCNDAGMELPERGGYGSGIVFLPKDDKERAFCKDIFSKVISEEGQNLLGWREVPVNDSEIGKTARDTRPVIEQVFIRRNSKIQDVFNFERKLYVIRKRIENAVRSSDLKEGNSFYITNISSRTITYKGLLMPAQVGNFFADLSDERIASAICMVHSRYSTNTFPTWNLAQPFRFLAHNGEINTLRGNINWMRAREGLLASKLFGKDLTKIFPVIVPGGSDSSSLDNIFELLVLAGRSLPHAMMMLIPAAWESDRQMDEKTRHFYQYQASLMEPWDGPAAIAYTDGTRIGACLDRNGLRPARYIVTADGLVAMASEVGVLDIEPERILRSGRLEPGKIFFVDTALGKIVDDAEIKKDVATLYPYGRWLKQSTITIDEIPHGKKETARKSDIMTDLKAFGYTREDLKTIIKPMAEKAQEPVGSMGND
ncbi:MAG TPA: glutamate synthase central domain-containing protein, partial [Candidatus Omnitrophota bacterium]|nr:glutamate synthase central domain-containing protein [Candidatus Omnitrophota bacterium]